MLLQKRIDLDQFRFDKFPPGEIAVDCTTHPIAICPCPIGALLPIPECQRNLVDYEICAPSVGERKNCKSQRSDLLVVRRYMDVNMARVHVDQMVDRGVSSVRPGRNLFRKRYDCHS